MGIKSYFAVTVLWGVLCHSNAYALECPRQPEQAKKDWNSEVSLAVAKIGPAKGADLQVKTRNVTQDLLGKLPDANKVYLEQMMYASFCTSLRDDKSISESERASRLRVYNAEVRKALYRQSHTERRGAKSKKTKSKTSDDQSRKTNESMKRLIFAYIDNYDRKMLPVLLKNFSNDKQTMLNVVTPLIDHSEALDKDNKELWKEVLTNRDLKVTADQVGGLIEILANERKSLRELEGNYVKWVEDLFNKQKEISGVSLYYRPALLRLDVADKENTSVYSCYDKIFSVVRDPLLEDLSIISFPSDGQPYYIADGWKPHDVAMKACRTYLASKGLMQEKQ